MAQLRRQGLHIGDLGNEDVSFPNRKALPVRAVVGRSVHALVVDAQLLARFHVVEDHHLPRPHHREFALLMRVEPGELDVSERPAPELHREEHDVFNLGLEIAFSLGGHPNRRLVQQVQGHRYVVRSEAPERVFVGADLSQVDPQPIQIINATQLPALDQRPQPLDRRVENQQVAGQDGHFAGRRRAGDGLGVLDPQGERLLDETRLPRLDALQRQARVGRRRRRDDGGVHPPQQVGRLRREVDGRILRRQPIARPGVGVAHRGELGLGEARRGPHMVPPPRPGADDPELEAAHP